jgi:membrane-associated phospholipid phosphatase
MVVPIRDFCYNIIFGGDILMKKLVYNIKALLWILSIPLSNVIYQLLNNSERGANSLVTDIDRSLPFVKLFAIPYLSWFLFIAAALIYLCFKDRNTYYKTLIVLNVSLIACYLIYYFYQTVVPRPELIGDDILTNLVKLIYNSDMPYNCFPSIHCLTSYIAAKSIKNSSLTYSWIKISAIAMAFMIIISTQFIKQHVVLDIISAIILGEIVFQLVFKLRGEMVTNWIRKQYSLLMMRRKLEI